jgi:hypothetical protein
MHLTGAACRLSQIRSLFSPAGNRAGRSAQEDKVVVTPVTIDSGLFVPIDCPANRDTLLALNPRGTRLAVSCERSDCIQVLNPRSGKEVTRCTGFRQVFGIEFLSAEVLLVTASDGCFRCDLRRGEREVLSSEAWRTRTAVSPNGHVVAIGGRGGMELYDVRKGRVLRRLGTGFTYQPIGTRAAFSAGGRYVAAELSDEYYHPILVGVWDAHNGRRQRIFDTGAQSLAFREDTMALAVACDNGRVYLFEPDQGEEPATELRVEKMACALQFRDGGRTLAALLWGGGFVEVELASGRVIRRLPPSAACEVYNVVSSADWSVFAGTTEGGAVVWPGDRAEPSPATDPARVSAF